MFLMKDKLKRGLVIAIFWAFLVYLGWMIFQWEPIVNSQLVSSSRDIPLYVILIALCIYMIFFYGIYPIHIKFSRATSLFIALFFIVISQFLANDWSKWIIIWDLFSVLWVVILILFPTNLITTDKVKKEKAKKNEVIIEV